MSQCVKASCVQPVFSLAALMTMDAVKAVLVFMFVQMLFACLHLQSQILYYVT